MTDRTRPDLDPGTPESGSVSGVSTVSPIHKEPLLGTESAAQPRIGTHEGASSQTQNRPERPRRHRPKGFVYFIGADHGPIKVGWSSKPPEQRLAQFQTGNPEALYVFGVLEGARTRESESHARLHRHRIRGEWFDRDAALDYLTDNWIEGTLTEGDEASLALQELSELYGGSA